MKLERGKNVDLEVVLLELLVDFPPVGVHSHINLFLLRRKLEERTEMNLRGQDLLSLVKEWYDVTEWEKQYVPIQPARELEFELPCALPFFFPEDDLTIQMSSDSSSGSEDQEEQNHQTKRPKHEETSAMAKIKCSSPQTKLQTVSTSKIYVQKGSPGQNCRCHCCAVKRKHLSPVLRKKRQLERKSCRKCLRPPDWNDRHDRLSKLTKPSVHFSPCS